MSEHGHCPFLNRTDQRCGEHLTIDSLDHAFEYCFDLYAACPLYLELLIERRTKNGDLAAAEPALQTAGRGSTRMRTPHVSGIVQVQVRRSVAYGNA